MIITTPANIEKYSTQNPHLYPCPKIAPHTNNQHQTWTSWKRSRLQLPPTHACKCSKTPVIHMHVVERSVGQTNVLQAEYVAGAHWTQTLAALDAYYPAIHFEQLHVHFCIST